MADQKHVEVLRQGSIAAWNEWRIIKSVQIPDLSGSDLGNTNLNLNAINLAGADLSGANLSGLSLNWATLVSANFSRANLHGAHLLRSDLLNASLSEADLRAVDFREAKLNGANLKDANLSGANLKDANLSGANLKDANLSGANLREANLTDACLDCANLTDARLWETQLGGWSIRDVICQRAFWDREGEEPTDYRESEFERIFAEKPRILLHYPGGMSPIDLLALPIVVERLQAEHPNSVLQVRSMQTDASGASVTITVEDRADRGPEAFGHELVRIQTKLECVVEERDRLQRSLDSILRQGTSIITEFLALPRQEVHIHRPTGLTAIEGPITMSTDTYNISGQAGAVGPGAHAHDNTFQQIQSGIDLPKLAEELGRLRASMKGEATGTREQDKAIGAVADAEEAATRGDGPAVLRYLRDAGIWALGIAEKIGVTVATDYLKKAV